MLDQNNDEKRLIIQTLRNRACTQEVVRNNVSRSNAAKGGVICFKLDTYNFQLLPLMAKYKLI